MIRIAASQIVDACRQGDINFRFSTRSSAADGIRGHQRVQKSRGESYHAEIPLALDVRVDGLDIEIHGRADGIEITGDRICIEEIKTMRTMPDDVPEDVRQSFWLQACLYGHMLCVHEQLEGVHLRICLYHLDTRQEHLEETWYDATDLACLFSDAVGFLASRLQRQADWRNHRDESLAASAFPYEVFRQGQRDMAVSVYRNLAAGQQVVLQAPTGIGKTMGTIYPAVRALRESNASRVFYLSARNSTQAMAEQAVADIVSSGSAIRSVTITARDRICFSPGEPCDPDRCAYARGYYDRVHDAMTSMLGEVPGNGAVFTRENIEAAAREHTLCPFELGLDLSRWSDVIIADYNYAFDPTVYLRRYFEGEQKDSILLVDESHNLVDRGRAMYSAQIVKEDYLELARLFREITAGQAVAAAARSVNRAILSLRNENRDNFTVQGWLTWREPPPAGVAGSLQKFCEAAEELLRQDTFLTGRDELLEGYFASLRFLRTAEYFDDSYVLLLEKRGRRHHLRLNCIDPSRRLRERFDATAATACFSATLQPQAYFRRLLGLSEEASWFRLPSPFPAEHLNVSIASHIDTSWRGRSSSLDDVIDLIDVMVRIRHGNYLVFFPSHDYLQMAASGYMARFPEQSVIVQDRNMDDGERSAFLDRFSSDETVEPVCGFAVMGGIFSEGIDLKGDRLVGVMVIGTGLPQVGIERDLIRDHFPEDGFDYAYRYPGLVRVIQTAGRVIRDQADRGVVCLVDRRFADARILNLLPSEWQPVTCRNNGEVGSTMQAFWKGLSPESEADTAGEALEVNLRT